MPITGFFDPPQAARYALRRVHVPACLLAEGTAAPVDWDDLAFCDLVVDNDKIADVAPAGSVAPGLGPDLDRALVLPGMLDAHAHLDKGHIVPRARNQTGDLLGAAAAAGPDRESRWHAEDVRRRLEFGLQTAYAKGVVAIRSHLDSQAPQPSITFPVVKQLREEWAGRVELQPSTICPIDTFLTDEGRDLADRVADMGGNLGCGTRFVAPMPSLVPPEFDTAMERIFTLAEERGLDLDMHVDESSDAEARTLIRIARMAVKRGFKGSILAGHCCALSLQTDEFIEKEQPSQIGLGRIERSAEPLLQGALHFAGESLAGREPRATPGRRRRERAPPRLLPAPKRACKPKREIPSGVRKAFAWPSVENK